MKALKRISSILALVLAVVTIPVIGHAAPLQPARTVMTFDQPVELPGIALAPGSYVFKTSDSGLVQVFDANETRVVGNFLTIPSYRLEPSDKTSVLWEERSAGSPQALKSWTDAGALIGHEFIYDSGR